MHRPRVADERAGDLRWLRATATDVLTRCLGAPVTLGPPELIREGGRSVVVRCGVAGATELGVTMVVVKYLKAKSALGFTDWASLRFLAQTPAAADLAPGVYGGDADQRVVVLQDLGGSDTLETLLADGTSEDRESAVHRAFQALALQYARLHGATADHRHESEGEFERICGQLPDATPPGRHAETERWLQGLPRIGEWLEVAGCAAPAGYLDACRWVGDTYAEPGPFLTFTHGDPAPSNNHVSSQGHDVRLLDFEYGAFRHALYDLTAWDVLCPLPERIVGAMRRVYRAALARRLPGASDAAAFRTAWGVMVAFRGLAILSWISCADGEADRPRVGDWSARQSVLAVAGRVRRATAGEVQLAPINQAATGLEEGLLRRWREYRERDVLPRWPALRKTRSAGARG